MQLKLPCTLSAPQNVVFTEGDYNDFKWLRESPRYYTVTKLIGKGRYSEAYLGFASDRNRVPLPSANGLKVVVKIPVIGAYERYNADQIAWRIKSMREQ